MRDITNEILELIRRTSSSLPKDVEERLRASIEKEEPGSAARGALETILKNIELSRANSTPICQDTGTPIFFIHYPEGWSTRKLREQVRAAMAEATKRSYMRPNAVDAIYDKNTGNNLGGDDFPYIHFEEVDADQPLVIELMLKGGGCENVGAQYSLPNSRLGVVFDREGYSAELYRYLDGRDQGQGKRRALFISWAKYADRWVNDLAEEQLNQVARVTHQIQKPEEIHYLETERSMSKYGKIRTIVIAWLVLLFGPASPSFSGSALEAAKEPPALQYEVAVTLKLIQACVTDKKGQPVRDLARGDFAVTDDGRPMTLTEFEKHDLDAPGLHFLGLRFEV